jgi:iron complex transport system substrate-binding protein
VLPPTPTTAATATTVATPVATSTAAVTTTAPTSATHYPLTVKDSQGTSVTFQNQPHKIVSLAPSNTEIVYALGRGASLVAGTEFDDFPAEAKKTALLKGLKPSVETILSYNPDVVLGGSLNAPETLQQLRAAKTPVLVLDANDLAGVYSNIAELGQVLDATPAADRVIADMRAKVDGVTTKVSAAKTKPRIFDEVDASDPSKIFTAGPGSFIDAIITQAGGVNVAHDAKTPYPQYNLESLLAANPEIIVLQDAEFGITPDAVAKRQGWSGIRAVADHKIFPIDTNLVSRPGPRLADGLIAMAKLIHPELFP